MVAAASAPSAPTVISYGAVHIARFRRRHRRDRRQPPLGWPIVAGDGVRQKGRVARWSTSGARWDADNLTPITACFRAPPPPPPPPLSPPPPPLPPRYRAERDRMPGFRWPRSRGQVCGRVRPGRRQCGRAESPASHAQRGDNGMRSGSVRSATRKTETPV